MSVNALDRRLSKLEENSTRRIETLADFVKYAYEKREAREKGCPIPDTRPIEWNPKLLEVLDMAASRKRSKQKLEKGV